MKVVRGSKQKPEQQLSLARITSIRDIIAFRNDIRKIPIISQYDYLGVTITDEGSFGKHIQRESRIVVTT